MKYLLLGLLAMIHFNQLTLAAEPAMTIIAHPSVPVNQLSINEVKNIYLLKKQQWIDGTSIVVINRLSGSQIRHRFEQEILGITPKKYALYIEKMHYSGVSLPVIQESTQAVIAFVQHVPGAIAYIEDLPHSNQVKVLLVVK